MHVYVILSSTTQKVNVKDYGMSFIISYQGKESNNMDHLPKLILAILAPFFDQICKDVTKIRRLLFTSAFIVDYMTKRKIAKTNSAFTILKANTTFIRKKTPNKHHHVRAGLQGEQVSAIRQQQGQAALPGKESQEQNVTTRPAGQRPGQQGHSLTVPKQKSRAGPVTASRVSQESQFLEQVCSKEQVGGEAGKPSQWVRISKGGSQAPAHPRRRAGEGTISHAAPKSTEEAPHCPLSRSSPLQPHDRRREHVLPEPAMRPGGQAPACGEGAARSQGAPTAPKTSARKFNDMDCFTSSRVPVLL